MIRVSRPSEDRVSTLPSSRGALPVDGQSFLPSIPACTGRRKRWFPTSKKAGGYRSELQEPARQHHWCSLSRCLSYVATVLGEAENPWPEVRNAISDGLLRARGTCFGIAHQPLRPEWMRVTMWDDANDDTIFFREEKGRDLVPPQRVPGHISHVEICRADVERWWPNSKVLAMSSLADMGLVDGAANNKPTSRSTDGAPQGKRGPKRGSLDRYGDSDRALFPKIEELIRTERVSANAAARWLAKKEQVDGVGDPASRAKRLATRYLQHQRQKLTETY